MNKKISFYGLMICLLLVSCGKSKKKVNYIDELELASVSVNRTFVMNDNKGKILWIFPYPKAGDRFAIFRMGASVFTAYIKLGKVKVDYDDDGNCKVKCPEIKIKGPDYVEFDSLTCKFKQIDYDEGREDFTAKEINKEEKKEFDEIKKLREDNDFIEKLIETAKISADTKLKQFIAISEGININNITIEF